MKVDFYKPKKDAWSVAILPFIAFSKLSTDCFLMVGWLLWAFEISWIKKEE